MSETATAKKKYSHGYGGGEGGTNEVPRYPAMACLGTVESVEDGKSYNNDLTVRFRVNIRPAGVVPVKHSASVEICAAFLDPALKPSDIKQVAGPDGEYLLKVFYTNMWVEPKIVDANGIPQDNREVPHLLGLTGIDYKAYDDLLGDLKALWPDQATSAAAIKSVLEQHLVGREIGYWLVQKVKHAGQDAEGNNLWERTNFFNIVKPSKFDDAAYFRPNEKGRAWVLKQCASEKNVNAAGDKYKAATFTADTVF